MAQTPKGRLVQSLYKPIHGTCAMYFYNLGVNIPVPWILWDFDQLKIFTGGWLNFLRVERSEAARDDVFPCLFVF